MEGTRQSKVILCCTGSVASLKIPEIVECLIKEQFLVKVVATDNALHFFDKDQVRCPVLTDTDEWEAWKGRGDPVLHVELCKWADILVIAPLDANTLGKISNGLCDNLLTCTVRAWNVRKPLYFAPAMNTAMWNHPITSEQISKLESWGYRHLPVVSKVLICGDKGAGAMAEVPTIVKAVISARSEIFSGT